jgi:hypothetical protein
MDEFTRKVQALAQIKRANEEASDASLTDQERAAAAERRARQAAETTWEELVARLRFRTHQAMNELPGMEIACDDRHEMGDVGAALFTMVDSEQGALTSVRFVVGRDLILRANLGTGERLEWPIAEAPQEQLDAVLISTLEDAVRRLTKAA